MDELELIRTRAKLQAVRRSLHDWLKKAEEQKADEGKKKTLSTLHKYAEEIEIEFCQIELEYKAIKGKYNNETFKNLKLKHDCIELQREIELNEKIKEEWNT